MIYFFENTGRLTFLRILEDNSDAVQRKCSNFNQQRHLETENDDIIIIGEAIRLYTNNTSDSEEDVTPHYTCIDILTKPAWPSEHWSKFIFFLMHSCVKSDFYTEKVDLLICSLFYLCSLVKRLF